MTTFGAIVTYESLNKQQNVDIDLTSAPNAPFLKCGSEKRLTKTVFSAVKVLKQVNVSSPTSLLDFNLHLKHEMVKLVHSLSWFKQKAFFLSLSSESSIDPHVCLIQ